MDLEAGLVGNPDAIPECRGARMEISGHIMSTQQARGRTNNLGKQPVCARCCQRRRHYKPQRVSIWPKSVFGPIIIHLNKSLFGLTK